MRFRVVTDGLVYWVEHETFARQWLFGPKKLCWKPVLVKDQGVHGRWSSQERAEYWMRQYIAREEKETRRAVKIVVAEGCSPSLEDVLSEEQDTWLRRTQKEVEELKCGGTDAQA